MQFFKSIFLSFILVLGLGIPNLVWPYAYSWKYLADFGMITDFNLFLTGDFYYRNSDVEGRVAVGGNVDLKSFSLGLKASPSDYTLIAGGNVTLGGSGDSEGGQINNGGLWAGGNVILERVGLPKGDIVAEGDIYLKQLTVENGSVIAGGNIVLENATVEGDVRAQGEISLTNANIHGTSVENTTISIEEPIDFNNIDLSRLATQLLENIGTSYNVTLDNQGKIYVDLDEICDNSVCLLDISETKFEEAWGVWIEGSSQKTAIIRVIPDNNTDNDTLSITHKSFRLFGSISDLNILYLFSSFENIEMGHIGLYGSILAPEANITFYEGVMYGSLFAYSLTSGNNERGGQINVPVPEPKTLFLLFTSSIVIFFFHKKKLINNNDQ